ncbi:MAG: OmpA family protein [Gammaproteobacteria bacterium]|nr:OmpA family protein [Gammaproteobacteria bacterium]
MGRYYFKRLGKLSKQLILIFLVFLGACQTTPTPSIIRDESRLPEQVALGDSEIIALEKRLIGRGIQIVSVGQNYLLSIPAASLFGDQSPQLTWESYDELNEVACYLRQFRKVGIDVTAYTTRYVSTKREHALSRARAEEVANYLWSQGVDARLLFTQGMGSDKPIVMAARSGDKSPNARIEITFRRAVA